MVGLVLAVLAGGIKYAVGGVPEEAFLTAAGFFFLWHLVLTIMALVVAGLAFLGLTAWLTAVGAIVGRENGPIGAMCGRFFGGLFGGAISVFILAVLAAKGTLLVLGAYLFRHAVVLSEGVYVWNIASLIIGGIFVAVALFVLRGTRSSSSNSSTRTTFKKRVR